MRFIYRARTKEGRLQAGTVEAVSRQAALEVLQRHHLTPISLEEEKISFSFFKELNIFKLRRRDLITFFRAFSFLFEAGVPLVEGLHILADQTHNTYFRRVILEIIDQVEGGMKLSGAFARHPDVFSEFNVNMVRSGETSGALQKVLLYLAEYTERDHRVRSNIRNALIYPAFIVSIFMIVFLILMVFVVPRLAEVLSQLGGEEDLPFVTRALIGISNFTQSWIFAILILLVGAVGFIVYYIKTPQGKEWWSWLQLKIPLFRTIFQQTYQARFADNLSTLIRGGIPIVDAITISADVVGNKVYERLIREIGENVKAGNTIESTVKIHEEFSPLLVEMIAIGERSGKLEEVLEKVVHFFQEEVDQAVDNLTSLIEPLLIVVLGLGVGLLVSAIIIPIYGIISGGGAG